jgi:hypothetical protein
MIKKINRTEEINKKLQLEGKITVLNSPEHIEAILKLNAEMEQVRRDFKYKNAKSEQGAGETFFTA